MRRARVDWESVRAVPEVAAKTLWRLLWRRR